MPALKTKWKYPGNATITKPSLHERRYLIKHKMKYKQRKRFSFQLIKTGALKCFYDWKSAENDKTLWYQIIRILVLKTDANFIDLIKVKEIKNK